MNKKRAFSVAILIFLLLFSMVFSKEEGIDFSRSFAPFSFSHPFGCDDMGRDYASLVALALRNTFVFSFSVTLFSLVFSFIVALAVLRFPSFLVFLNALKSIPKVLLVLFLVSLWGNGVAPLFIAIAVAEITDNSRVLYTKMQNIREKEYIKAEHMLGIRGKNIALKHYLPSLLPIMGELALTVFSAAIAAEASLSFLSLGLPAEYVSLGKLMSSGYRYIFSHPSLIVLPSLFIFMLSLSLYLTRESLKD